MPAAATRLLDPATRDAIRDLRLEARGAVDGFLAGNHAAAAAGPGVELDRYRAYQPGDDPRRIDWRAYARSRRLVVREAEVERSAVVRFVLDASASMAHRDSASGDDRRTKLDHARGLVAAIADLAARRGDRLAAHILGGEHLDLPPRRDGRDLEALLARLVAIEPGGRWPPRDQLLSRLGRPIGREIVVAVSDLYQDGDEILDLLDVLAARGHEVLVLHLMARDELDFTFRGDVLFEDLESGATVRGHAEDFRTAYLGRLEAHLDDWRRKLASRGVHHHLIATDQPAGSALRAWLLGRRALAAGGRR